MQGRLNMTIYSGTPSAIVEPFEQTLMDDNRRYSVHAYSDVDYHIARIMRE